MNAQPSRGFGTFQGVFRPTFLTIMGAMLYLREGWLVGTNGLLGALGIIAVAVLITGTTALSASSIATNQRVRAGGAFAIISQALGLEAGGAIGGPLYIAQALSASMYAYAFSEAFIDTWAAWGGGALPLVPIALAAFVAVTAVTLWSTSLAFTAQRFMLVLVAVAMVCMFAGVFTAPLETPTLLARQGDGGLIGSFAIFFPAVTGIMVGVGMSGQLTDPRRAIPRGTMMAWGATAAIYVLGAVWYSVVATPEELVSSNTIAFDRAAIGPVVRIGLLTSTLMAALSSLVAASQLLAAMAQQRVVPLGAWISHESADGGARRAIVLTAGIASLGLLSGSLDAIAPIITAFFILTYLALNGVVLLEQRLAMISFRPTFPVPTWVPALGVALCTIGLFLASPRLILTLGLVAVVSIYLGLGRRRLETPWETVYSGINVALATWAARKAARIGRTERAWKPDLLVPLAHADQAGRVRSLVHCMASRHGSVKLMAVGDDPALRDAAERLRAHLDQGGTFATTTALTTKAFSSAFTTALAAMQGDLFPPNLVLLELGILDEAGLAEVQDHCRALRLGLALYVPAPGTPDGDVQVWLSDRSPDWELKLHTQNLDLPVLIGWLVAVARGRRLSLHTALRPQDGAPAASEARARSFFQHVIRACRLPDETGISVRSGAFMDLLRDAQSGALHVFGMPPETTHAQLQAIADAAGGESLFLMDSGRESAFA